MNENYVELTRWIKGYVQQVEIIHRRGNPIFYNTLYRLEALDRVRVLLVMERFGPRVVMNLSEDLVKVLPHPSNKCYDKTRDGLLGTIRFCRDELGKEVKQC